MRAALTLAAAAIVGAPAALACTPVPYKPMDRPRQGTACAVSWSEAASRQVGLSAGIDLGSGFVMQDIYDGNFCYWESNLLFHDCAAGRALVIGHDDRDRMIEPVETGLDRIAAAALTAARAGAPLPLEAIEAMAAAEGYATRLRLSTSARINVNGWVTRIDCACRSFYPGLGPGN